MMDTSQKRKTNAAAMYRLSREAACIESQSLTQVRSLNNVSYDTKICTAFLIPSHYLVFVGLDRAAIAQKFNEYRTFKKCICDA